MSNISFRPVRGTESNIVNQPLHNGYVYFATDSGKIYLDTDEDRYSLGANGAAVLYSNAENVISNTDNSYTILYSYLDDQNAIPKAGDLIINSDGRFFRVNYYDAVSAIINCKLIAVSGSGGGGGSTGPSGPDDDTTDPKKIQVTYHDLVYSFLSGRKYTIDFTPISQVDLYLNISYTVRNAQNYTIDFGSIQARSGDRVSLNVGKYMTAEGGYHAVDIIIQGANSYEYNRTITRIKCVDLKVANDPERFTSQKIYDGSVQYYVKVYGQIDKTLNVFVDNKIIDTKILGSGVSDSSEYVNINCKELGLTPGVHTISAYLTADGVNSNTVYTDFIYHPIGTADATYVIVTEYPEECMSYETPAVYYWVYNTAKTEGSENDIDLIVDGVLIEEVKEKQYEGSNNKLLWNVTGLKPNAKNICEINSGNGSRTFEIYCTLSHIFDPITDGAVVLLNTEGRSNNTSLERRLIWEYENDKNQTIKATLNNFNWYNNGWITDKNGRDCLRISNGASVEIPLELFDKESPSNGGFTFEFEFNPYNLYSYNLLTQSTVTVEGDDEVDDTVEILREFDASLAAIKYTTTRGSNSDFGICCGTQDAFFRMSDGKNVTVRYNNDNIVNVAVTIDAAKQQICMYVNGVMSGMVAYDRSSAKLPIYADKIIINSEQCDLDLYNIRIYSQALSSQQVVQNYIASKKDMDIYNQNIFSAADNTVKLNDLISYNTDNPGNATIPYMVFKTVAPDILPYNKANDDVICSIDFVNPALDYALSKGEIDEAYYKKHAPSFSAENVTINVQGTSSQKYPRKNFKGKFKKAKNWKCTHEKIEDPSLSKFYMNDNIAEKTICWKADYMDSSSCHNTGFASYVQELYWNHPLDYYEGTNVAPANKDGQTGEYYKKYRTSLYGFPVLVFHEKSNGTTEFIGRYNFNLDKGADDTLGMALDKQHPILTDKTYEKVCECWEMANNMGGRCSFRGNPFDYGYDYDYEWPDGSKGAYIDVNGNPYGQSDIGDDLEVRYHINGDAIEGAWDNLTKPADDGGVPITSKQAFEVLLGGDKDGNNRSGAYAELEKLFKWLNSCYYAFDLKTDEDKAWAEEILGRPIIFDASGNLSEGELDKNDPSSYAAMTETRRIKFESEFEKHLNMEYCLIYYIMTELLLQYDSRGKNMMISSWGPMETGGDYIWFPIFYDIDTQLGVNNSGIPSWEYNVEPTTGFNNPGGSKAFSTANSLLWNNFHQSYAVLGNLVQTRYQALRGGNLTIGKINGYYNFDYNISKAYCMKGILPISIMNANQYYKYIAPSTDGYIIGVDDSDAPKYRTTSAYFYCLQGTRDLHRAQLLRNRFNYYDSKWMAQDYQPGTGGLTMRWRGNAYNDPDHPELKGNLILRIKPALDQYLVLWLDESATYVYPTFAKGGDIIEIDLSQYMTSSEYQQQLIYIGGYSYLQEFGDVSLLYLDEFEYPGDAKNITKIQMGNENPAYRPNEQYKVDAIDESTTNKPLLKVFDITNINKINTKIKLTDSVKLETFKALGTKITGATFADGVNLRHLYLPSTVTSLALTKASNLEKIMYNPEELKVTNQDGNSIDAEGIYIDNVIVENDGKKTTNISEINIVGGNLGLYSYEFLDKITNAVQNMISNSGTGTLAINMEDVQWTPFKKLGEGAVYKASNASNYKYATNNYSYSNYVYDGETKWNNDLLNGRIYEYVASDINAPPTLDLLNVYIDDNVIIDNNGTPDDLSDDSNLGPAHFTNITDTKVKGYPIITGELYIDNKDTASISEAEIANIYNQYFPSLSIRAAKITDAYRARFVRVENNIESEIKVQRVDIKDAASTPIQPPANNEIPAPNHYDFRGWSLTNPSGVADVDSIEIIQDFSQYTLNASNKELTFYAIYKKHEYEISFQDLTAASGDEYSEIVKIEYGNSLREPIKMPYRGNAESALKPEERIAFKGWTDVKDNAGLVGTEIVNDILVDVTAYIADRNYTFYAVFVKETVWDSVTDSKYFTFTPTDHKDDGGGFDISGVAIAIHPDYYKALRGKITLPTISPDGLPVISVAQYGMSSDKAPAVTHIFFDKNHPNEYRRFGQGAFENMNTQNENGEESQLKYIDMDALTKLRVISSQAFRYDHNLNLENFGINLYEMQDNILTQAMENSGGKKNLHISGTVVKMSDGAIANCDIPFESLTLGGPGDPSELTGWKAGTNGPLVYQNFGYQIKKLTIYCTADREEVFNSWMTGWENGQSFIQIAYSDGSSEHVEVGSYEIVITTKGGE